MQLTASLSPALDCGEKLRQKNFPQYGREDRDFPAQGNRVYEWIMRGRGSGCHAVEVIVVICATGCSLMVSRLVLDNNPQLMQLNV